MNLFITGTDTDAGKTTVSAWICSHISRIKKARYWKPIQTGDDSDASIVRAFAPHTEIIPEAYRLKAPLSAFDAAKKEGVEIDVGRFGDPSLEVAFSENSEKADSAFEKKNPTKNTRELSDKEVSGKSVALDMAGAVIEGAGGVFVPISTKFLMIDLIKRTNSKALVVARSKLGLINHILLTVFALRSWEIPVVGIVICGDLDSDLGNTIEKFAETKILAILPTIPESEERSESDCELGGGVRSSAFKPNHAFLANLFEKTPVPKEILEILV